MKGIVIGIVLILGLAGVGRAELLTGQVMVHSKEGRVLGLGTSGGLTAVAYGENMHVTGVPSLADIQLCDEVEIDFTWSGSSRVIKSLALKYKGSAESCPILRAPIVAASELYRALDAKSAAVFDVRSAGEYRAAHFAGAVNLPLDEIESRIAEIPKDKPVILYCGTSRRALFAAVLLKEKGVRVSYVKGKLVVQDGKPQILEQ